MERTIDLRGYLANLFLIWVSIGIYHGAGYYVQFIRGDTRSALVFLAFAYTLIAFPLHIWRPRKTRGYHALRAVVSNFKNRKISTEEKHSLLFVGVKFYFLPIMLNFAFSNLSFVGGLLQKLPSADFLFSVSGFNQSLFPLILGSVFLLDTSIFAFGYAFEASYLKNTLRTVDTTFLGWAAALACYPPFNNFVSRFASWYANDYAYFFNEQMTFFFRMLVVFFLLVYLGATFALFTKSSNLTNRGIVTNGPYAIIRHPAYIAKNLVWWTTLLPVLSWPAAFSMAIWSGIYHVRTITEEKHLMKDPDYVTYCKKVKYRYIPFVY